MQSEELRSSENEFLSAQTHIFGLDVRKAKRSTSIYGEDVDYDSTTRTVIQNEDKIVENWSDHAAFPTWSVVVGFLLIIIITIYCIRRFVCRRKPYDAVALGAFGMTSKDSFNEDMKQTV